MRSLLNRIDTSDRKIKACNELLLSIRLKMWPDKKKAMVQPIAEPLAPKIDNAVKAHRIAFDCFLLGKTFLLQIRSIASSKLLLHSKYWIQ